MAPLASIHFVEEDKAQVRHIAVLTFKNEKDSLHETHIPIFPGKDIFVGRDENRCSAIIQSSIVSRVHFRIYSVIYDDDLIAEFPPLLYCEDRQSSNGTYVNNTLIGTFSSPRSPYLLNDGDVVSIRPHWKFHFHQKKQINGKNLDGLQTKEVELFKDQYTISNRLLGSGVYGSVYLAKDLVTQKQLACKVVDLRMDATERDWYDTTLDSTQSIKIQAYAEKDRGIAEVRKKLIREIEILSKLSHPNIATLYKAFRTPNSLYIFNELAAGGDLFSFLQANGSCVEDLHARIISRQIAIAVDYLHSNGIAHRDLKPENILVMRTDIGHRVVLTDFGCAGYISNSSRMMSTVGTYDYVAPEVHRLQSRGYTEAIDMWSMGIIILCLLTGDALLSFEELQEMGQDDIALKLATASYDYPQWGNLNVHGKDFVNRLLVLEPLKRMTAKEAVDHDWFRKPSRIAVELDKLYERATAFWSRRTNCIGIIEELPDVTELEGAQSATRHNALRILAHKRIPDAASPYFSLERHLQPAGARTRSMLHSKRRKILANLMETDSQFIVTPTQPMHDFVTKNMRPKVSFSPEILEEPATSMSQGTTPILRPIGSSTSGTAIRIMLAPQSRCPTDTELKGRKPPTSKSSGPKMNVQGINMAKRTGHRGKDPDNPTSADTRRRRKYSPQTSLSIKHADANNLFGTVPIEIKAAEDAEAAQVAYENTHQSLPYILYGQDGASEYGTPERLVKTPVRSYGSDIEDRELDDEAATGLLNLSTSYC